MVKKNNVRVDLHIHSTASDGCWSPAQIVEQVQRNEIGLFAVTDHDNVDHVQASAELARRHQLAFLSGVEISGKLDDRVVHILGYGFDLTHTPFLDFVRANELLLHTYDDFLVQQLLDAGHEIDLDAYQNYEWDRHRGGWKALNFLIDVGLCRDVASFFGELFVGPLQVAFPDVPAPHEIVAAIQAAGGVAVWAHPANSLSKYPENDPADDELIVEQMLAAGIEGLECFACHHDLEWTQRCLAWAQRYNLLVTGGSDSHGGFVGRQLGYPEIHWDDLNLGVIADRVQW
jgi:predicted metal-dependent phosphoesterase TrpH